MTLTPAQKGRITTLFNKLQKNSSNEKSAAAILKFIKQHDKVSDLYEFVAQKINTLKSTFLNWLTYWNEIQIVNKLITAEVSIGFNNRHGNNTLHTAANLKRLEIVQLLLQRDLLYAHIEDEALTEIRNRDNLSPADLCQSGEILTLLNEHTIKFHAIKQAARGVSETPIPDSKTDNGFSWAGKDTACYNVPAEMISPVVQIQWMDLSSTNLIQNVSSQRWGTGFLLNATTVVTAGHCFDQQQGKWHCLYKDGQPVPSKELVKFMTVNFNYQSNQCGDHTDGAADYEVRFRIKDLKEHRIGGLDFAVAELDTKPWSIGKKAKTLNLSNYGSLSLSAKLPALNSTLSIIQHPDGSPKKIQSGPLKQIDEKHGTVSYAVSTEGGSSGAPVIDEKTQKVIAIHTSGFPSQGGPQLNSGVSIAAVSKVSPIISKFALLGNHSEYKKAPLPVESKSEQKAFHAPSSLALSTVMQTPLPPEQESTVRSTYRPALLAAPRQQKPFLDIALEAAMTDYRSNKFDSAYNKLIHLHKNFGSQLNTVQQADILFYCGNCSFQLNNIANALACYQVSFELKEETTCLIKLQECQKILQEQPTVRNNDSCVIA